MLAREQNDALISDWVSLREELEAGDLNRPNDLEAYRYLTNEAYLLVFGHLPETEGVEGVSQ